MKVVARASNKGERFAFIVMGSHSEAQKAVEDLNGKELKGKSIHVEIVSILFVIFTCLLT